jgi:hypothetical protein
MVLSNCAQSSQTCLAAKMNREQADLDNQSSIFRQGPALFQPIGGRKVGKSLVFQETLTPTRQYLQATPSTHHVLFLQ